VIYLVFAFLAYWLHMYSRHYSSIIFFGIQKPVKRINSYIIWHDITFQSSKLLTNPSGGGLEKVL
jgi:hypothetical protein